MHAVMMDILYWISELWQMEKLRTIQTIWSNAMLDYGIGLQKTSSNDAFPEESSP
jgi:hypothetical protein